MGLSNVPWELELANLPWEWDYPMCPVNGTSQCALGMGLSNVPWDIRLSNVRTGNGTSQ